MPRQKGEVKMYKIILAVFVLACSASTGSGGEHRHYHYIPRVFPYLDNVFGERYYRCRPRMRRYYHWHPFVPYLDCPWHSGELGDWGEYDGIESW